MSTTTFAAIASTLPVGSPGMEVTGTDPAAYEVMLFGSGEPKIFFRFKGAEPV